jgi:hypothetical protein
VRCFGLDVAERAYSLLAMSLPPSASTEAWLCALLRLVGSSERALSLLAGFLFFLAALVFFCLLGGFALCPGFSSGSRLGAWC